MCTNTNTGTSWRIQDALTGEGKESVEVCQKAFSQNPNKMERRPGLSPLKGAFHGQGSRLLECGNKTLLLSLGLKSIPLPPVPHFSDALGASNQSQILRALRSSTCVFLITAFVDCSSNVFFFLLSFNWRPLFLCGFKRL